MENRTIIYEDFKSFIEKHSDCIFRMWVYKKMFTPYEQDKKYIDETCYEDVNSRYVCIREYIPLPDGDILLGVQEILDKSDIYTKQSKWFIEYYKLSEIRLHFCAEDEAMF